MRFAAAAVTSWMNTFDDDVTDSWLRHTRKDKHVQMSVSIYESIQFLNQSLRFSTSVCPTGHVCVVIQITTEYDNFFC